MDDRFHGYEDPADRQDRLERQLRRDQRRLATRCIPHTDSLICNINQALNTLQPGTPTDAEGAE
jgi:hypothetical protein